MEPNPFMTNSAHTITTLLFDWDGTVVDSAQLGLNAFEHSFAALGVVFDQDIYRAAYSPNWYTVYEALGLPKENGSAPTSSGTNTTADKPSILPPARQRLSKP